MRRQYPFHLIEPKWRRSWEAAALSRLEPRRGHPPDHPFAGRHGLSGKVPRTSFRPSSISLTCSRILPARACMSAIRKVTRRRIFWPATVARWIQRPSSDGLGRLRSSRRAIRHPHRPASAKNDRSEHRRLQTANSIARFQLRLVAGNGHHRPALFQMDAVDFPSSFTIRWFNPATNKAEPIETLPTPGRRQQIRPKPSASIVTASAGLRQRSAGLVVRGIGHRPGQRGSHRRQERSRRISGHAPPDAPMDAANHRLRGTLLQGLDKIEWSDSLKEMQRNWIGRSEGAEVVFPAGRKDRADDHSFYNAA